MPKLRNMVRETAEVTIPVDGDDPLVISYRKSFMTPALSARIENLAALKVSEQLATVAEMVHRLVVEWNLTGDDDQVIPLTIEAISGVEVDALVVIATAIREANAPDPLSGSASKPTSSAEASSSESTTSPTTTPSS